MPKGSSFRKDLTTSTSKDYSHKLERSTKSKWIMCMTGEPKLPLKISHCSNPNKGLKSKSNPKCSMWRIRRRKLWIRQSITFKWIMELLAERS
jgi:hypothetical protein